MIDVRVAEPQDLPFIFSTWLKSYKVSSVVGRSTSSQVFFKHYNEVIDRILAESKVLVACSKEDRHTIIGYLVYEPEIVHYLFVKSVFRNLGIATQLLNCAELGSGDVQTTHMTNGYHARYTYNPFLLYKKAETKE